MKARARVLVVDDHPFIREGIRFYLRNSQDFEVVGAAEDCQGAIDKARDLNPDVIIMDVSLPAVDGLEATRRVRALMPSVKILVLTTQHRGDLVYRARTAGASGCLAKDCSPPELLEALEAVSRGKAFYPSSHQPRQRKNSSDQKLKAGLTQREVQVLTLLGEGLSNKAVADRLGISIRTVEKHRENILETLGMHNIADLVRFAVGEGLVKLSSGLPDR
jgi:DNA-binding NarL/FixJ family response regulator